jgi:cation-transporting P-type ATPase 13A3/4/5
MGLKTNADYINIDTEDEMEIYGFKRSKLKWYLILSLYILTVGALRLIFYWKPNWKVKTTHTKCRLEVAHKVLLRDKYGKWFVEEICVNNEIDNIECCREILFTKKNKNADIKINNDINEEQQEDKDAFLMKNNDSSKSININIDDEQKEDQISSYVLKYFINKHCKYIWNDESKEFQKLIGIDNFSLNHFNRIMQQGLSESEQTVKRSIYGYNSIEINLTPIHKLFINEILSPFYIFQLFSCTIWILDDYVYYSLCILVISVISIIYTLYSIRKNEISLRNMIHSNHTVTVLRKKFVSTTTNSPTQQFYEEEINSELLVPGDVVIIKNASTMQCDALLLNGNVIVNESILTGNIKSFV